MAIIILIPLCIIFIVAWSSKSTDKKHDKYLKTKKEKTNLALQEYYTKTVTEIIQNEYNKLLDDGKTERTAIVQLFDKYNMPLREYFEGELLQNNVQETPEGLTKLIVRKQMAELGYKYSYDGKLSILEQVNKTGEVCKKMKQDYWWL